MVEMKHAAQSEQLAKGLKGRQVTFAVNPTSREGADDSLEAPAF